jgi:hypothetical protein
MKHFLIVKVDRRVQKHLAKSKIFYNTSISEDAPCLSTFIAKRATRYILPDFKTT